MPGRPTATYAFGDDDVATRRLALLAEALPAARLSGIDRSRWMAV